MDLINQNKFKNGLIVVLLIMNLLTLSIIWMQTSKRDDARPNEKKNGRPESVTLMKEALNLNDQQTKELDKIRSEKLEESKKYNDSLDVLKKQLAGELLNKNPDTLLAKSKANEIGEMQSKVELIRFSHFKELMRICTPEQREKLKPILIEIFGRKPPKEEQRTDKYGSRPPEDRRAIDRKRPEQNADINPARPENRTAPPSIDERITRLTDKLNLSDDQVEKIKKLLTVIKKRDQELRNRINPDRNQIEKEKDEIRKEEDENIMKVLNDEQKREFSKMIAKRRK